MLVDGHDVEVHVHNHASESVELRRLEIEREERMRAEERRERLEAEAAAYRRRWWAALAAYLAALMALVAVTSLVRAKPLSALAGFLLLFGPVALFVTRSARRERLRRG